MNTFTKEELDKIKKSAEKAKADYLSGKISLEELKVIQRENFSKGYKK